jgi:hypothetical protein
MATLDDLALQVNANTEWINGVIASGKKINELDTQSPTTTTGEIAVVDSGVTKKVSIAELIIKFIDATFVTISGLEFRISKASANVDRTILEVNDEITGYIDNGDTFLMAKYLGGDQTDFTNEAVYESFSGF